jgi:hypothetical protein
MKGSLTVRQGEEQWVRSQAGMRQAVENAPGVTLSPPRLVTTSSSDYERLCVHDPSWHSTPKIERDRMHVANRLIEYIRDREAPRLRLSQHVAGVARRCGVPVRARA